MTDEGKSEEGEYGYGARQRRGRECRNLIEQDDESSCGMRGESRKVGRMRGTNIEKRETLRAGAHEAQVRIRITG
eukprot:763058-Hanusia_phi.AAC.3